MPYCSSCGSQVAEGVAFCPSCGAPIQKVAQAPPQTPPAAPAYPPQPGFGAPGQYPPGYPPQPGQYPPGYPQYGPMPGEKSPIIALILSFIFTGLGQFYNGEASKGIVFVLVAILLWIMTILFIFPCIILIPFWIYGMYAACTHYYQYTRSLRAPGR